MDTKNTEEKGRDAVQPPVREDAVQGDVRDVAAEGVGQEVIARLRAALRIAHHGLTTCHGLMAYDDGTVIGAKQHFRLDHTEELAAIKEALAVKS